MRERVRVDCHTAPLPFKSTTRPCPALPCPALPCPALPCPALPCPALPCPALPWVLAAVAVLQDLPQLSRRQELARQQVVSRPAVLAAAVTRSSGQQRSIWARSSSVARWLATQLLFAKLLLQSSQCSCCLRT
jgi:hypothetical protein